jgi:flagellar biosynthesis protein FlhF
MKIDGEDPNSTEALAMYCEALGIPLLRSTSELLNVDADMVVYFDVPGAISDAKNRAHLQQSMTDLGISSRVLVVNAAYERELIKHFYQESVSLGATHVVFTHLDELLHFGKLWEFVLDAGLAPLFASTGPNLADDCERDIVGFLVHKTLTAGKSPAT